MQRIPQVSDTELSADQKQALANVKRDWGVEFNIMKTMVHNPSILNGFLAFWMAIEKSGLNAEDREVICMEMANRNGCSYCTAAHLVTADQRQVDMGKINRIADGKLIEDNSRAASLQRLTRRLVETGGQLGDDELADFRAKGFDNTQLIAIVAEIAHCHFTNTFNRLAQTEIDPMFKKT